MRIEKDILRIIMVAVAFSSIELLAHPMKYHKLRKKGDGHLSITLEGKEADINFIGTSLDVFGFEIEPTKDDVKGQKIIEEFRVRVKANAEKMIIFDPSLGCKTKAYILGTFVGEHDTEETRENIEDKGSKKELDPIEAAEEKKFLEEQKTAPKADIYLRFHAVCKQSFKGKEIKFGLTTVFPKIVKVRLQLVTGTTVKARFIKKNRGGVTP